MAKFPSQEWADAFRAAINESDAYARAAKEWEGDFYFVIEGDTDEALYIDLWHGACRTCQYTTDLTGENPEFCIRGKTEKWQRIVRGKLDPVQALMTRQLKLDGSMIKIMKNVKAAQELVRCATHVDSEF